MIVINWQGALGQNLKVGDVLPDFTLDKLVNSSSTTFHSSSTKDKLLIIEFWGTWCAPCIPALIHLDSLQKYFPNELTVIAVSDDSPERLQKFLVKRPTSIPLASDPEGKMQAIFHYRIVPHTILVDRNQRIVAITTPDQISSTTINALLKGQPVSLALKQDAEFDPKNDYFAADPLTVSSSQIQPYRQGFPSMMKPGRDQFKNRRVTFINVLPSMIIQYAYGYSPIRTKSELPKEATVFIPENLVCFDIIVPQDSSSELRKLIRQELAKQFPIKVQVVKTSTQVYALKLDKASVVLTPSTQSNQYSSSGKGIEAQGEPIEVLRNYLENMLGRPVIDETGLTGHYDYKLEIRQEDLKPSLAESLRKVGLTLEETQREIDFLTLKPE